MSQVLEKARTYEKEQAKRIVGDMRPAFHLTPYVGWMNDPNGLSFYKGKYHMFYQYYPYRSQWGPMHWGHAVSKDLLHWDYLPAAIAPDMPYDNAGCFSGSAIELEDGRQLLMYTGVTRVENEDGEMVDCQTQCLAVGDGVNYVKYEKNPVLTEADLPEGASKIDFRDPKLWKDEEGIYWAVIGNRPADGSGQILLFRSEDAFSWRYFSTLDENQNRFGKMWECPDFFPLNDKHVLLVSPQDMLPEGFEYHNGNGNLCLIGTFDKEKGKFLEEHDQAVDYGIDFYAQQTVATKDGLRVMIGWMQNWDACAIRAQEEAWAGQMSLPREIWIQNNRLYQRPTREYESCLGNRVKYTDVLIGADKEKVQLDGISGRTIDLQIQISSVDKDNPYYKFTIYFAKKDGMYTSLSFRPYEGIVKIDRKFSGSRRAIVHQRRMFVPGCADGSIKLRLVLDRYSSELFVGDGSQTMTTAIYTDMSAQEISFACDGEAKMDIVKQDILL